MKLSLDRYDIYHNPRSKTTSINFRNVKRFHGAQFQLRQIQSKLYLLLPPAPSSPQTSADPIGQISVMFERKTFADFVCNIFDHQAFIDVIRRSVNTMLGLSIAWADAHLTAFIRSHKCFSSVCSSVFLRVGLFLYQIVLLLDDLHNSASRDTLVSNAINFLGRRCRVVKKEVYKLLMR